MNPYLKKLYETGNAPERLIVGLMSGTSLDGLDVALCRFRRHGIQTKAELLHFCTIPYEEEVKAMVRQVFAQRQVDFEYLTLLNPWIGRFHGELVLRCLEGWGVNPSTIDLIASHGQTVYHAPSHQHGLPGFGNATLQIGDGDHLAYVTGIITLSDFRQKHVAAGGEGAPLALYGDYLLFSTPAEDRILLNMGGIANFTFLPADQDPKRVFTTDTGPGNTLLDNTVRRFFPGMAYDKDGLLAASGQLHQKLLDALLDHPFFKAPFPKSTGPELFNEHYLDKALAGYAALSAEDLLATLCRFTAKGIALGVELFLKEEKKPVFYLSGGGMHNPVVLHNLRELLPGCQLKTTQDLHILPDAKEAVLFAALANQTVAGTVLNLGEGFPAVSFGKISFPG
jgi:anhydro-N-acetylmuramic acid kinase